MRELTTFEYTLVSGGRKSRPEIDREKRCLDKVARNSNDVLGSRGFKELIANGLGALFGGARTIQNNKDCQDAMRLTRQKDRIERHKNGEYGFDGGNKRSLER